MPWLNVDVDLVDAEEAVGPVGVGLEAEAAQPVAREQARRTSIAVVVGHEAEAGRR